MDKFNFRKLLEESKALILLTGAGMGVDSGLKDFRGENGLWGELEKESGTTVFDSLNGTTFLENPLFAWNFFSKRIQEFIEHEPHKGFYILQDWIRNFNLDYFCFTSNIDNYLQRAGFEENKIRELHGNAFYLQSCDGSTKQIEYINELENILLSIQNYEIPKLQSGLNARPCVYLFSDPYYINERNNLQKQNYLEFLEKYKNEKIIAIEIGSGPHVQAIRQKTRQINKDFNAFIIRINPKEYEIRKPHLGIKDKAVSGLEMLNKLIS